MKDSEISIYDLCYAKKPFSLLKKWADKQAKDGCVTMKFWIEYDDYGGISELKLKSYK